MARYLFFRTSRSTFDQISALFNFVWPTATALWNLRWQVVGFAQINPDATKETLHGRFVAGSGIQGAHLKHACIEQSWEQQQAEFARFILFNLFAIYEGWLAMTLKEIGMSGLSKELQFPSSASPAGASQGFGSASSRLQQQTSAMMEDAFYALLRSHPKNSLQRIDSLLLAYRCFKELRNTMMHAGGIADQKCVHAYVEYSALTKSDLGLSETPQVFAVTLGNPVRLSLRGVVGFSEIILRLVATLDAEFARTQGAERELLSQWVSHFTEPGASSPQRFTLSTNISKRHHHLRRLLGKLALPKPTDVSALEALLQGRNLVTW